MTTRFTLCFMTGRPEPRLDWVLEDLAAQYRHGDEIDLLVVDVHNRPLTQVEDSIVAKMPGVVPRVVPPKPTIWQGEYRITQANWWATASARNTAIVMAKHDYFVCIDDRCHLGPEWLSTVRKYEAERTAVLIGSYDKYEDGGLVSQDHRRGLEPRGKKYCAPGWLYGCAFGLPLEWALTVNGFEEGCDGLTGEDYIFGDMLANNGYACDFVPEFFVKQDRTKGNESCKGTYRCMDKGQSPNDKSHAALARFGDRTSTEFTPNLRALRDRYLKVEAAGMLWTFPVPDPSATYLDWYDGQPIREMV